MSLSRQQSQSATPEPSTMSRLRADDLIEVLAYIDFYVAKRLSPKKLGESIVNRLRHSRQKDFTIQQIDDRMKQLWAFKANRSATGHGDHPQIYKVGTKALHLEHGQRMAIRARVQQMLIESVSDTATRRRTRDRRTRKARRAEPGVEGRRYSSRRATQVAVAIFSTVSQPQTTSPSIVTQVSGIGIDSRRQGMGGLTSRSQVLPSPSSKRETSQLGESRRSLSMISDSQHSESLHSSTISATSGTVEDQRNFHRNCSSVRSEPPFTSSGRLDDCEYHLQLLSEREKDVEYYRLELSKAQSVNRTLENQIRSEENERQIAYKDGGQPTQHTLLCYLNEIEILRSQLQDKRSLQPFTSEKRHMPTDVRYFESNMDTIAGVIGDFMSCAEMSNMCNDIKFEEQHEDLRLLFRRVVGESHNPLQCVSFHSLLRSLLSAAVCEWVLECDVQEHLLRSCPLRETMLSHLVTQDGITVARNLDFAAHHTLVEGEYFQNELIPRRAEALVDRISATLKPLFGLQKSVARWKIDILKKWDEKQPDLKSMFVSALNIKTRALVTKDKFEVIFPPQGHQYDRHLMEPEDLKGGKGGPMSGQASFVRLCLVPGLSKQAIDRKSVDYNSFKRPGSGSEEPFHLIAKSLVNFYQ